MSLFISEMLTHFVFTYSIIYYKITAAVLLPINHTIKLMMNCRQKWQPCEFLVCFAMNAAKVYTHFGNHTESHFNEACPTFSDTFCAAQLASQDVLKYM